LGGKGGSWVKGLELEKVKVREKVKKNRRGEGGEDDGERGQCSSLDECPPQKSVKSRGEKSVKSRGEFHHFCEFPQQASSS